MAIVAFFALLRSQSFIREQISPSQNRIPTETVATSLHALSENKRFPTDVMITRKGKAVRAQVQYTLDPIAQSYVDDELRKWGPDYAAFVAIDAKTGRVLALSSYQHDSKLDLGHLALRATYPAASVFKVITAAAAIEQNNFSGDSLIPFTGTYHTLYRRNVLSQKETRWTRYMSLKEAFAKSVNSVFGKIGAFHVGHNTLKEYAERFMFNKSLTADFPVTMGAGIFDETDEWRLAEVASGFTRNTTLNPVQGAMIAASVINDGVMMTPTLVESVTDEAGEVLYRSTPVVASVPMSEQTAARLRMLMRETVVSGTSSRAFRNLIRKKPVGELEVGGKTGSLTGADPSGRYDWYVGYARHEDQAIAVAALTINEQKWRVKSAQLASQFVTQYYQRFAKRMPSTAHQVKNEQ